MTPILESLVAPLIAPKAGLKTGLVLNKARGGEALLPGTRGRKPSPKSRRVVREGKFLRVGGKRFYIRGVTYGTFRPNEQGEPYPPLHVLQDDFYRMREEGVNTVRLYTPPSERIANAAAKAGLFLVPDICWGPRWCELDDEDRMRFLRDWVRGHARRLAGHPAILMYSLGNEIPPLLVRWYGRKRIENFLRELRDLAVSEAPNTLITYVNHPPTEYLDLPFLDVVAYNVYLEREPEFRAYLDRLQTLAGDRPLFLAEIGLDSRRNGEGAHAQFLDWQLRAVFEKGLCGAAVYSWTDEWQIFDSAIEGWSFGLTEADRQPKLALSAVREVFHLRHTQLAPFGITNLARQGNDICLTWTTVGGTTNIVQCLGAGIRGSFTNCSAPLLIPGIGAASASFTDFGAASGAKARFYRILQP